MSDKKNKAEKPQKKDEKGKSNQASQAKSSEKPVQKNSKDDKKNTSLRLDKKTLKALKIRAIEEETSVQKLIEKLIKTYLNQQ